MFLATPGRPHVRGWPVGGAGATDGCPRQDHPRASDPALLDRLAPSATSCPASYQPSRFGCSRYSTWKSCGTNRASKPLRSWRPTETTPCAQFPTTWTSARTAATTPTPTKPPLCGIRSTLLRIDSLAADSHVWRPRLRVDGFRTPLDSWVILLLADYEGTQSQRRP